MAKSNLFLNCISAYFKVPTIKYQEKDLKGRIIIFNTVRSMPLPMHQELFLAYQLAEMGAEVIILLDDGMLKHWDTFQEHDKKEYLNLYPSKGHKLGLTGIRANMIKHIFKHKNIKFAYYSGFVSRDIHSVELNDAERSHAISSVRRYFEVGICDLNNKNHKRYFDDSILNCKITKSVAQNLLLEYKIDLMITSHGIYSTWGPFYLTVKNHNIPIIVYGAHAYRPREIIITSVLSQTLSQDPDWKTFEKSDSLSDDQKAKIVHYFNSRINHTAFDTSIYYSHIQKFNEIEIDNNNSLTFGLFPNIIWDGDIKERDTIFDGVVDWVVKTVNYFKHNKNNLVIRFHPAESTLWKDSKSFEKILRNLIPDIDNYNNIRLISSSETIDTYDFVKKNIDVGLIYDGVLAMELTYLKIPVISCAKSRYTGAGFVIEPQSIDNYYSLLTNFVSEINSFRKSYELLFNKLLKYAYWYFFVAGYQFPIFDKKQPLVINYKDLSKTELSKYSNPKLKRTLDKITSYIPRS